MKSICLIFFLGMLMASGLSAQNLDVTFTGINGTAIGATTPSTGAFTTLNASSVVTISSGGSPILEMNGAPVGNNTCRINMVTSTTQTNWRIGHNLTAAGVFEITPSTASGGATFTTPAAEFSSAGVLVRSRLEVTGAVTDLLVADASSGLVYIGTAGAAPGSSVAGIRLADPAHVASSVFSAGSATSALTLIDFINGNGAVGSIVTSGSATAYNTASDVRLKTNIRDLPRSGEIVDALRPRLFDWRTGEKNTYGFVAQEVDAVFPQAVTRGDDDPEHIARQWSMDASKLVPVLTAEIKSLRSRVAALEAARAGETSAIADLSRQLAALRTEVAARPYRASAASLVSQFDPPTP
jgi:hypothetical protein